ncbi:MAG TPA: CRISPR-associated helicase Cas3' [Caldithrix abyssi]|uniref:CRISPR-associated helicase Cas3 n=1 Tax=Caldithrix abyssi TaxID=187145 RepID=A0A7V4U001_CALAY|nr:CRISPR-associated helicase Cas3' [Caldithrix abyssi]
MPLNEIIAHARMLSDGTFDKPHLLSDHLSGTASIAEKFSRVFGLQKLGRTLGLTHDLGKASPAFQRRIRLASGFDTEAHLEGKSPGHVDHSTAGAQFLLQHYGPQAGLILAYIVAGHHAGLPDGKGEGDAVLARRLEKTVADYNLILEWLVKQLPPLSPVDFITEKSKKKQLDPFKIQFLIRMLFSVLTDADFLDTEQYMEPLKNRQRKQPITLEKVTGQFDKFLETLKKKEQTKINKDRNRILELCLKAAEQTPGIFSLTVPTGGGKTIASMAFALRHALKHGLRRVIYIIPYTSIITQNAQVFRDIFAPLGRNIVLEHHSNLEPHTENETPFNRLAAENWDAPIIVTTNVRFFESFYANRSSACRRLHNVADSVLIFDEAQMLPPEMMNPSLKVVETLTEEYGCSTVICTATQPALIKSNFLREGLSEVREIIPDPQKLYRDFKRVIVKSLAGKSDIPGLAGKIAEYERVLTIVNTRKEARLLYQELTHRVQADQCFHLSTMMCPKHRGDILRTVRQQLKENLPCRVVSTQLIEAGVDVDFPVVFRAVAGIDSIAQAAGRCNREGKMKTGTLFVFETDTPPPPGHLRHSAESGLYAMKVFPEDVLSLQAVDFYFKDFYNKQYHAHQMDKKHILKACRSTPDAIPFRRISRDFSLINDKTISIIVPYEDGGRETIEKLRNCYQGIVPRDLRRETQRYLVNIREHVFASLYKAGVIEDIFQDGQYLVLINPDIYDSKVGLNPDQPEFLQSESLII